LIDYRKIKASAHPERVGNDANIHAIAAVAFRTGNKNSTTAQLMAEIDKETDFYHSRLGNLDLLGTQHLLQKAVTIGNRVLEQQRKFGNPSPDGEFFDEAAHKTITDMARNYEDRNLFIEEYTELHEWYENQQKDSDKDSPINLSVHWR
jgi:hypothetical protein